MQIVYEEKFIVFPPLHIHIKPIFNKHSIQIIIYIYISTSKTKDFNK